MQILEATQSLYLAAYHLTVGSKLSKTVKSNGRVTFYFEPASEQVTTGFYTGGTVNVQEYIANLCKVRDLAKGGRNE